MNIPAGFSPLSRTSPVSELIGPIHTRGMGSELVLGLRVVEKHCNSRGTMHGGMLATLADMALGYAAAFSTQPPTALVTANLSLDYAGTAKVGDWLETSVDVQRVGSRLAFASAAIWVDGQHIVRASAVLAVVAETRT